jgi:hypothetical protein
MTYLEIINEVLARLRETSVQTSTQTTYSSLIGRLVNDAKRQVEDAYSWNVLAQTITITTVAGTYEYSMTGAGQKFRVEDALNVTDNVVMRNLSNSQMQRKQNFSTPTSSSPTEFAFDGVDASGDTKVTLYPRPDNVYSLKFFVFVPQDDLAIDSDVLLVKPELVIQSAYARALVERGEDGGLSSSEAFALYRTMLSDYIALEVSRYPEFQEFVPT